MGQYHVIYNVTKKEYFSIGGAKLWGKTCSKISSMGLLVLLSNSNGRGGGDLNNPIFEETHKFNKQNKYIKLKKPSYYKHVNGKGRVDVSKKEYDNTQNALDLISGRWAGDKIVIQGDYAEEADQCFIEKRFLNKFKNISNLIFNAFTLTCSDSDEINKELNFEKKFIKK